MSLVAGLVGTVVLILGLPASAATGPVFPVMNTSETPPDGVWFRDNPNVSGPRLNGYGVYNGDRVQLQCYGWGESLGRYANRLWYYSANLTRPNAPGRPNVGWLNAHYINDGQNANVVTPGVPQCGAPGSGDGSTGGGGGSTGGGGGSTGGGEPVGTAFGQSCGMVTLIAVPGSYETQSGAPAGVAKGLLKDVTDRLHADPHSIRTHYIGYPATIFSLPLNASYFNSKNQGYQATWSTVQYYGKQCPTTKFVLFGYSQGAHIVGDLASTIDKTNQPVPASSIRSVRLLADPARNSNHLPAVGAQPGRWSANGLAGGRGEYGAMSSRVTEYCASNDPVCDLNPANATRLPALIATQRGTHTQYASSQKVPGTNTTFTARLADDIAQDVVNLNGAQF